MMRRSDDRPAAASAAEERRRAWEYYRAILRGRCGRDYEDVEAAAWQSLQRELEDLERRAPTRS